MKQLTEKMTSFAEEYVANGFNGSKAYQKAYGQKNKAIAASEAFKLLQDIRIIDKIRDIQGSYEVIGLRLGIDKKLVMGKVLELLNAQKTTYAQGAAVGTDPDYAAINNGIDKYAKLTGGFEPTKAILTVEEQEVDISKLTDEEKEELRAKILKGM